MILSRDLHNKITEIAKFMSGNNIKVCTIQETRLSNCCRIPNCDRYDVLRNDRARGGGLAFLLQRNLVDILHRVRPVCGNIYTATV